MQITERDIFNYVFFREGLSKEKKDYVENSPLFKETIEFYSSLRDSLMEETDFDTKRKIALKISAYKPVNIIYLHPVVEHFKSKRSNGLVLAAASEEQKPKVSSKTFYDEDKTYIIKVINYKKSSKVFVFSTQYELVKDFHLNILPQNLKYYIADSSVPLELDFIIEPESISLEFNLSKRS